MMSNAREKEASALRRHLATNQSIADFSRRAVPSD